MWQIVVGILFSLLGVGLVAVGAVLYSQTENPINLITMLSGLFTAAMGGYVIGMATADR